jgi:hypothetical protein
VTYIDPPTEPDHVGMGMDRTGDTMSLVDSDRGYDFHTLFLMGTEFADPETGKPCHTTAYGRGYNRVTGAEIEPHTEKFWGKPEFFIDHPDSCFTHTETWIGSWRADHPITVVSHLCVWRCEGLLDRDLDRVMATDARPRVQGTYRVIHDGLRVTGFELLDHGDNDG